MLRNIVLSLLLLGIPVFLIGCTSVGTTTVSTKDFVQKAADDDAAKIAELVAGDAIELSVEVDGRMEVSAHRAGINHFGMATLPLVGDVRIGGLTLGDARSVIAETYGAYFVNPPVIMISRLEDSAEGEWGHVTVTGRVGQPGRVKILSSKGIKLTAAIQESGGFGGSAKKNDIRISRTEKDGRRLRVSVDYNDIGQDGNVDADLDLVDGDIVYVPERIF
jgi:polysaccharide biosynthesis/export protein